MEDDRNIWRQTNQLTVMCFPTMSLTVLNMTERSEKEMVTMVDTRTSLRRVYVWTKRGMGESESYGYDDEDEKCDVDVDEKPRCDYEVLVLRMDGSMGTR